jgi:hypothetical protein
MLTLHISLFLLSGITPPTALCRLDASPNNQKRRFYRQETSTMEATAMPSGKTIRTDHQNQSLIALENQVLFPTVSKNSNY